MNQGVLGGMPDPPRRHSKLWPRYTDGGKIAHTAWLRACAEHDLVGDCECGGKLHPEPPDQIGSRLDYRATCNSCRTDIVCPGGRTLRGRR